jgi:cytoskeletal protein RodZ
MKTIGQVLENARKEKKISLQELEETTKIKNLSSNQSKKKNGMTFLRFLQCLVL